MNELEKNMVAGIYGFIKTNNAIENLVEEYKSTEDYFRKEEICESVLALCDSLVVEMREIQNQYNKTLREGMTSELEDEIYEDFLSYLNAAIRGRNMSERAYDIQKKCITFVADSEAGFSSKLTKNRIESTAYALSSLVFTILTVGVIHILLGRISFEEKESLDMAINMLYGQLGILSFSGGYLSLESFLGRLDEIGKVKKQEKRFINRIKFAKTRKY